MHHLNKLWYDFFFKIINSPTHGFFEDLYSISNDFIIIIIFGFKNLYLFYIFYFYFHYYDTYLLEVITVEKKISQS